LQQDLPDLGLGAATIDGASDVGLDLLPAVMNFVKAGKLRPLAVAAPRRLASLSEVPTVSEAGVPGYTISSWYGVFAPAGTPAAIVRKIHAAVNRAQDLPDVKERMDILGADEMRTASPEAFAAMVKSEFARYAKVIKATGIHID
jgi:tripartite-type tricarboxylate transporter receptor subunit TctC